MFKALFVQKLKEEGAIMGATAEIFEGVSMEGISMEEFIGLGTLRLGMLLEKGNGAIPKNLFGETLLHFFAKKTGFLVTYWVQIYESCRSDVISRMLLARDIEGHTPLDLAKKHNNEIAINYLKRFGAE